MLISDGAVIKCNCELCVKVVSKSNIPSNSPRESLCHVTVCVVSLLRLVADRVSKEGSEMRRHRQYEVEAPGVDSQDKQARGRNWNLLKLHERFLAKPPKLLFQIIRRR
jgi:hypothetical protein